MPKITTTTKHTVGDGPGVSTNVTTSEVIDALYMHISNSGINVETTERVSTGHSEGYEGDKSHLNGDHSVYKSWDLDYDLGAFGVRLSSKLSLHTASQCDALIMVLNNVKKRMLDHYGEEGKSPYNDLTDYEPSIINGHKIREKYSDPTVSLVDNKYIHIISNLLGYDLLDDEDNVVGFEYRTGRNRMKIAGFKAKPGLLEHYQNMSNEELWAVVKKENEAGCCDSSDDDSDDVSDEDENTTVEYDDESIVINQKIARLEDLPDSTQDMLDEVRDNFMKGAEKDKNLKSED